MHAAHDTCAWTRWTMVICCKPSRSLVKRWVCSLSTALWPNAFSCTRLRWSAMGSCLLVPPWAARQSATAYCKRSVLRFMPTCSILLQCPTLLAFLPTWLQQNQLVCAKLAWTKLSNYMISICHNSKATICGVQHAASLHFAIKKPYLHVSTSPTTYMLAPALTVMLTANHRLVSPAAGHDPPS